MDYQSLKDEIYSRPDLASLIVTNDMPKDTSGKDQLIADALNLNAKEVTHRNVDEAEFLNSLGAVAADVILNKLDNLALSVSPLKRALRSFYTDRGVDFGSDQFRGIIDMLTDDGDPTKLTTAEATSIKALAEVDRNITRADVSIALRGNSVFTPV